jgi:hypothetical protein
MRRMRDIMVGFILGITFLLIIMIFLFVLILDGDKK